MFDIGFMELLLIGVVALLVLGPEKMPGAIRTSALWIGRAKRSFNKVKTEIEQQLNTDDIRRQLHNESILADIENAKKNASKLAKDTEENIEKGLKGAKNSVDETVDSVKNLAAVTNSAEEGAPTPPPEGPESSPDLPSPADADNSQAAAEPVKEKDTHSDIYSTPPSGRVSTQGGRFVAPEKNDHPEQEQAPNTRPDSNKDAAEKH